MNLDGGFSRRMAIGAFALIVSPLAGCANTPQGGGATPAPTLQEGGAATAHPASQNASGSPSTLSGEGFPQAGGFELSGELLEMFHSTSGERLFGPAAVLVRLETISAGDSPCIYAPGDRLTLSFNVKTKVTDVGGSASSFDSLRAGRKVGAGGKVLGSTEATCVFYADEIQLQG